MLMPLLVVAAARRECLGNSARYHLFAVMILFQEAFPNAPGVASDTRHSIAYIAVGETCPPLHF